MNKRELEQEYQKLLAEKQELNQQLEIAKSKAEENLKFDSKVSLILIKSDNSEYINKNLTSSLKELTKHEKLVNEILKRNDNKKMIISEFHKHLFDILREKEII